ncbi:beta-galactosidase [Cellulomonas phragmiteti]|uniref:Beta-galactosidase n=1 Tax=Cellulomonas phragmiteti TaxID=478780 RepID=A0ABQ4DQ71_9CELL|nr:beta-galactosidase [Cellulomonas phragmiteti]GIG41506.1 beta-galactosidase [Cellulomonas phragmiteti]
MTTLRASRARAPLAALSDTVGLLYGADWNPEQWHPEVWHDDVALMRDAGVNVVTVGVFSWATLEPRPGRFELDWLDRVIDLATEHGILVDLATPTASPPPWLGVLWPSARAVTAEGVRMSHGSRNHFCPSSPHYRERALSVVRVLAARYGAHPGVRMWHVGNEYGQVCWCEHCAHAFRRWLRARYGGLEELNRAWGTAFWSQRYDEWAHVVPPRAAPYLVNPTQTLDHRRFASDQLLALYLEQRDVIAEHAPGVPVTTNLMGFHRPTDYWRWAPHLDVVADDVYGDPAEPEDVVRVALSHDLARGLAGGGPWMVMEQAAGAVSWRPHNVPKTTAQLRLDSLRAIARGADGSCFFQWRASVVGAERFHSALVPHAGPDTALHRAVAAHGAELVRLREVVGTRVAARVALVFDWSSWWAAEEPGGPSTRLRVLPQVLAYYRPLWSRGVGVDVVPPGADLDAYDLVVAPQLFLVDDAHVPGLRRVVERGGVLLVGPFSGVVDRDGHVRRGRFPVPFADLVGGSGEEQVPLPPAGVRVRSELLGDVAVHDWAERLRVDDGEALATVEGGDLDGCPLVLRRRHDGGGEGWYVGALLAQDGVDAVVAACLAAAGVAGPAGVHAGPDVEVVRRGDVVFCLNASDGPRAVELDGAAGTWHDLLSGADVADRVPLAAHGALALIERTS